MSKDYYNDGEFSEYQNIIKQESIKANLRSIRCDCYDMFVHFINWLADSKEGLDWSGSEICSVVEKPHLYKKQFNQFMIEEWEVE